jgi:hypothetical protein
MRLSGCANSEREAGWEPGSLKDPLHLPDDLPVPEDDGAAAPRHDAPAGRAAGHRRHPAAGTTFEARTAQM